VNINTKYDPGQEVQAKLVDVWIDAVITLIEYGEEGLQYVLEPKKGSRSIFAREEEMRLNPIFTEEEFEELGVYNDANKAFCEKVVRLYLAREVKGEH